MSGLLWLQAQPQSDPGFGMLVPMALIFVIFYFLLIRPQQKKMKVHRAMVETVKRGDRVVTGGGLVGIVTKAPPEGNEIQVEIAEGVRVKVVRKTLQDVFSKGEAPDKGGQAARKPANDAGAAPKGGFGLSSLFGLKGKSGK